MMRKKLLVLAVCLVLPLLLAGCANNAGDMVSNAASKAGDALSRVGDDVSEAVSRVESFLEGDGNASGTVDSGSDGFLGDESSGSDNSSFLEGGSSLMDDDSSLPESDSSGESR